MSIGMILLVVVAILTLFGVSQRVLDRMRLTDRMALILIAAMFVGGFIPNIPLGGSVSVNIGGALVPLGLSVYLFIKADTAKEKIRTIIAVVITGGIVYALGRLMPDEPETMVLDPNYLYGIVGGVVAYIAGRSRRGAFIAGVVGVILSQITNAVVLAVQGRPYTLNIGGAGCFDVIIISGLLAVILAEVVGEIIEKIARAPKNDEKDDKSNA